MKRINKMRITAVSDRTLPLWLSPSSVLPPETQDTNCRMKVGVFICVAVQRADGPADQKNDISIGFRSRCHFAPAKKWCSVTERVQTNPEKYLTHDSAAAVVQRASNTAEISVKLQVGRWTDVPSRQMCLLVASLPLWWHRVSEGGFLAH